MFNTREDLIVLIKNELYRNFISDFDDIYTIENIESFLSDNILEDQLIVGKIYHLSFKDDLILN